MRTLAQVPLSTEDPSAWSLVFDGFDPTKEGIREALCTLGNGYFATRAAAVWAEADDVHYPGTYLAGGYNRLQTNIAGRMVENEDLVNFPNWLALNFRIAEEGWFDVGLVTILSYRQELDLRRGILLPTVRFEDRKGRRISVAGTTSRFDGRHASGRAGTVADGRELVADPSRSVRRSTDASSTQARSCITVSTTSIWSRWQARSLAKMVFTCWCAPPNRNVQVAQVARTQIVPRRTRFSRSQRQVIKEPGYIGQELTIDIKQGETLDGGEAGRLYTPRATRRSPSAGWRRARP